MVVHHIELGMQSRKAQVQEVGGHAADDQKQIKTIFSPHEVLQS